MHRKSKLMLLALLGVVSSVLAAGSWQATQWQTLFNQVPAPPTTLAQAGTSIGVVKNAAGNVSLGLRDPALLHSRADYHAGIDAISQAAVNNQGANLTNANAAAGGGASAGIDVARMHSDPAYAQQIQQKMASMSQAEKMQMAMQMAASQQQSQQAMLANPAGLRAGSELTSFAVGDEGQKLGAAGTAMHQRFVQLIADYDARHVALGQQLATALKACPVLPFSVCHKECGPDRQCLAGINQKVPALIAQHRQLAAAELADEHALFNKTRATIQAGIAKAAKLTAAAEAAGTPFAQRQAGYMLIATATTRLQEFTALATLRAGYWQNIQQRTVPDDYFAATPDIGYQYVLSGDDRLTAAPTDLPKGW